MFVVTQCRLEKLLHKAKRLVVWAWLKVLVRTRSQTIDINVNFI